MKIIRVSLFALLLVSTADITRACTTFLLNKNGQLLFGRNYDWLTGSGMVCVNTRGLYKVSSKTSDGETISWVSKYGSITFNQYGKEFPTGGMNEKGLVVELMWLDATEYPKPDERPALGVLQWIQYQLDNSGTIDEVIASDKQIRIASKGTTPIHYLVADARGRAATIEFIDGKLLVHQGNDLPVPVLTNNTYEESIRLTGGAGNTGSSAPSFADNSIDRFAKACNMVKKFHQVDMPGSPIDYSFSILETVSQGPATKWSIVYDITNKAIHFRSYGYNDIKKLAFSSFNFECSGLSKAWDINQVGKGDISSKFSTFTLEMNRRIVERSFYESREMIPVSEDRQRQTWEYAVLPTCQN